LSQSHKQPQETAWSRRRAAVRAEAEADVKQAAAQARAEVRADVQASQAGKSDADILRELSLQDPDQMVAGDDFSAFLRDEVPQRLQRRALRALWRSNPVLACVDDLLDYGDDFKAEGMGGVVIRTAYQIGKGMLAHVDEMEKQATEASGEVSEEVPLQEAPDANTAAEVAQSAPADDAVVVGGTGIASDDTADPAEAPTAQITPRRMRFEFEAST
jgi:Protein of unknown function (DUF3306)